MAPRVRECSRLGDSTWAGAARRARRLAVGLWLLLAVGMLLAQAVNGPRSSDSGAGVYSGVCDWVEWAVGLPVGRLVREGGVKIFLGGRGGARGGYVHGSTYAVSKYVR